MQALTSSPAHPHIHNHSSSSYRGQPGLSASCAHPTARAGHNPRYSQHKGRSRICHATKQQIDAVVADLDACVQGLEVVTTAWAFQAAQATNSGGSIAGSPGVYVRYMAQLLPVIQQPHEAAFMLRLLHEEGIVGARSTAGREGPVVGRAVRQSGSRPLLLNEILEHWTDEILPTCLLRWSRQAGCSPGQLEALVAAAYQEAQRTVKWEVQDVQQQLHGSSSSSSTGRRSSSATSFSGEQRAAGAAANVGGSASSAVQCLTQPVAQAAAAADGVVALTVQPFVSVVPCLRDCPAQVYVASAYPQQLTEAVLSAVQLQQRTTVAAAGSSAGGGGGVKQQQQQPVVQVLYGSTLQQCLQQLQHQQQQQQPQQQQHQQQLVGGSIANGGSSSISSRHDVSVGVHQSQSQLLVLLSSPSRRPQKHQQPHHHHHLQDTQHSDDDTAASATQEETSCLPPPSQQQPPAAQQPAQPPRMQVQVAEWACKAPSLRARSLSTEGLGLLSEWGLAELLGVDSSDAVMDGIAWRRS